MAYGLAQVRTAQDCGFAFPGRMWLQMLEKIQECDEAIPDAVGYHSRNQALSRKRHDRHYGPNKENGYQSDPTLVVVTHRSAIRIAAAVGASSILISFRKSSTPKAREF
jgi:hypothetical protein